MWLEKTQFLFLQKIQDQSSPPQIQLYIHPSSGDTVLAEAELPSLPRPALNPSSLSLVPETVFTNP